jgi:hypothetical protein
VSERKNEGTDTIDVSTWTHLVYHGYFQAAVGLLCDVFDTLHRIESLPEGGGNDLREDSGANLRQNLMQMLGDLDGTELRGWLDLYRSETTRGQCLEAMREWAEEANEIAVQEESKDSLP